MGAGSYAQGNLLPHLKKFSNIDLKGVLNATGSASRSVAERFEFEFCTDDEDHILRNENINTVFIASKHDSHARYVTKALTSGKNVFVEKPLCLSETQLKGIYSELDDINKGGQAGILMVGYNRRYSPLAEILKDAMGQGPMAMIYRINAGSIPGETWVHDKDIGGGRIIGEVCHFVDFLTFLNGTLPTKIGATGMRTAHDLEDILTITLSYENGSIGTISYFSNGDRGLPKEYVEAHSNGISAILNDFKSVSIYSKGKRRVKKLASQNKGQKNEIKKFIKAIEDNRPCLIPYDEIYSTSMTTFKAVESLRNGTIIDLERLSVRDR